MRIRTKTAIVLFVTSLVPVGLLGFVFFPTFQKALTQSVTQHLEATAAGHVARVNLILLHQRDLIQQIESRKMLQESLSAYNAKGQAEDPVEIQRNLNRILSVMPGLRSIAILDLKGAVLATTDLDQRGVSYGGYDFFPSAMTHQVLISISSASQMDARKRLFLRLAGPFRWQQKVIGIILIQTEIDQISAMANDYSGFGDTGETFLVTQTPTRRALVYLTPLRFDQNAMLARHTPTADLSNDLATAILTGQRGLLQNITDYRGQSVLAVVASINSTPWSLVVKIDQEEAFVQILRLQEIFGLSLALVLFLIGCLSLWISRKLTAPILHLEAVVREVEAGNLSARVNTISPDEIGHLATAFNGLAQRLQVSNQQVQAGIADLARSNADLTQFAYAASHDLQEPLRIITGYLTLLQQRYQGHLDQNADEFIAFVVDASKRMQGLIHDLLTYSRVGREKTFTPTDLNEALQMALGNLQAARNEVAMEITADPLPTVRARPIEMVQIFQNLLGNAIKFRGERPLAIHVGVTRATRAADLDEWVFSVRDNGIGIEPKYIERIFIIFERLHGVGGKYPGSGIGLALCRKIVEQHDGQIWVESAPDQGSTFWFTLPIADEKSEQRGPIKKTDNEDATVIQ